MGKVRVGEARELLPDYERVLGRDHDITLATEVGGLETFGSGPY